MTRPIGARLAPALLCAALASCAVGPDFHRPTRPAAPDYGAARMQPHDSAQDFVKGQDIPGQWWTLFHSPALNALIDRALAANPTLQSAQAALVQARENLYAQEGNFFPDITATFEPSRNKTATRSVSIASASGSPYYTLYTAQLGISYTPDVFGGIRRQVENLAATAESQRFQLEATYLTLTSNLVAAAINEASLRAQIAATTKIITAETDLLGILKKQLAVGQVAEVDMLAQQAALAAAQATLPPLRKQLDQQRDAIAAYIGTTPDQAIPQSFVLDQIGLPKSVPVSIPAALVDQRPDIRQAEENLHAASAAVGVAVANRLPTLTLSAYGGSESNFFRDLFASGNGFWTIAASLSQPVFDGGTLLHKARAARAALDQAAAQYRNTVLTAFQNVADSLAALQADADALTAASSAQQAASETLGIVKLQVSQGQVAYLGILSAQQTALQAELTLAQAKASRLADTAALFQAMGGGWWHRQDSEVRDIKGNDPLAIIGIH
jgi:NodT family efflux transporter outer membrane factor (OMF) lipoprotein